MYSWKRRENSRSLWRLVSREALPAYGIRTPSFLSVPRFSPHHAKPSAQLCFSTSAVSILTSSANNLTSTRFCLSQPWLRHRRAHLDPLCCCECARRLHTPGAQQVVDNVPVKGAVDAAVSARLGATSLTLPTPWPRPSPPAATACPRHAPVGLGAHWAPRPQAAGHQACA